MERLYSGDSYLSEFKAEITRVVPCQNGWEVSLSRTAFYPESGGQPADQGWINDVPVVNVVDTSEGPVHIVSTGNLFVSQEVQCRIDWNRRFDYMQHHTGQHILSQAFLEICGTATVSFHLSCDSATIDLSVESLPEEMLFETEIRANKAVTENMEIRVYPFDSSKQKDIPVRKPSTRQGPVRIVEISNWDYSPCGGTHCKSTGEVGIIKITRLERIRQLLRVHFCCGGRALRNFQKKSGLVSDLGQLLSCGEDDLLENLKKEIENGCQQTKKHQKLQLKIISLIL
ncbi:MAG: alanine--tRNA ligase-related protein [Acidobacteriota bacterium]